MNSEPKLKIPVFGDYIARQKSRTSSKKRYTMNSKLTVILALVALIGTACSKEDNGPDDRNNLEALQGQILYEYTSNVKR